ncbi:MAG: hypothetical protein IKO27_06560 [Ruminococcus sp.]|nr:hypothetical protein [Ruminococcus sp.]
MTGRRFTVIFRIVVIFTFIMGMIYLISFVGLSQAPARSTKEEFLDSCRSWTNIFFIYMLMCLGSTALSVLNFRSGSKPAAVVRTAVLAFASVADILAVKYVYVFRGYEDAFEAAKELDSLIDKGSFFIIFSFVGAMLLFFLMISSVYTIIRTARVDEFDKVIDPAAKPAAKGGKQVQDNNSDQ